jgi:hypothetical protein
VEVSTFGIAGAAAEAALENIPNPRAEIRINKTSLFTSKSYFPRATFERTLWPISRVGSG